MFSSVLLELLRERSKTTYTAQSLEAPQQHDTSELSWFHQVQRENGLQWGHEAVNTSLIWLRGRISVNALMVIATNKQVMLNYLITVIGNDDITDFIQCMIYDLKLSSAFRYVSRSSIRLRHGMWLVRFVFSYIFNSENKYSLYSSNICRPTLLAFTDASYCLICSLLT
jgi:hypothetical protein